MWGFLGVNIEAGEMYSNPPILRDDASDPYRNVSDVAKNFGIVQNSLIKLAAALSSGETFQERSLKPLGSQIG